MELGIGGRHLIYINKIVYTWNTIQVLSSGQAKNKKLWYICNNFLLAHPNQDRPTILERGQIKVLHGEVSDSEELQFKFQLSYKSSLKQSPNRDLKKVRHFLFEQMLVEGYICGKPQGVILLKITPRRSGNNQTPLKPQRIHPRHMRKWISSS